MIAPPALWALRIAAAYILVPFACSWDQRWVMHLPTIVGVLLTAIVIIDMWRLWRRTGIRASTDVPGILGRSRFLAMFGVMNGIFWILVMIAEDLASVMIDPCMTQSVPLRWLR